MTLGDRLRRSRDGDLDLHRIAHDSARHAADILRHGSGEHNGLAVCRQPADDGHDVVIETHVQHPVGFIEDKILDAGEVDIVYVHLAQQPSGRSNDDVRSSLQAVDLVSPRAIIPSAVDSDGGERDVETESLHLLVYLLRELARRRHNDGIEFVGVVVVEGEVGQQRQDIRRGLSCAGLGTRDDIPPIEDDRYRLLLDGRACIEMHVPQGVQDFVRKC